VCVKNKIVTNLPKIGTIVFWCKGEND